MVEIIETHQPALWVYGHTHECDDQTMGRTRIISNQLGYPGNLGAFECKDFDEAGLPVEVGDQSNLGKSFPIFTELKNGRIGS
jgi:hypothetical protein